MGAMPGQGDTFEVPLRFSQAQFDAFARISGDDNPIHVDPEFCAGTRFGRTVAHGMLLFGMLDAATSRWIDEPVALWSQELTFRAPTFADDDLRATLIIESASDRFVRVGQWLHRSDGKETAGGHTVVGYTDELRSADGVADAPASDSGELHGIQAGMEASMSRVVTASDVAAYRELVGGTNPRYAPDASIPPPLLGGLVSHLLGVEVPGRGTNWLRQRYTFHRPVPVGSTVETQVEVTRVRPEKELVNLTTTCSVGSHTAVTGEALVLISDLERI
jgi:acyl dehydratase